VISLSDQRKPWAIIERRLEAAGAADQGPAVHLLSTWRGWSTMTRSRQM